MSGGSFGWIEIIFFYGLAVGFGVWQYVSVSRELNRTRAERLAREAQEAALQPPDDVKAKAPENPAGS